MELTLQKIFPNGAPANVVAEFQNILQSSQAPNVCVENAVDCLVRNNIATTDEVRDYITGNFAILKSAARMNIMFKQIQIVQ